MDNMTTMHLFTLFVVMCSLGVWHQVKATPQLSQDESEECTMCHNVFRLVIERAKSEAMVTALVDAINGMCDGHRSKTEKRLCHEGVDGVMNELVTEIWNVFDPEFACQEVEKCLFGQNSAVLHKFGSRNQATQCDQCQADVQIMDDQFGKSAFTAQMRLRLDVVCRGLSSHRGACVRAIYKITPQIVAYLGEVLDPLTTCTDIDLCSARPGRGVYSIMPVSTHKDGDSSNQLLFCDACLMAAGATLEGTVGSMISIVADMIDNTCKILFIPFVIDLCIDTVWSISDTVDNLIIGTGTDTICIAMELC